MPPKTLVRRARKNIRQRRIRACERDVSANLEKVEMRVHRHNKAKREIRRKITNEPLEPVPRSVAMGEMNQELYEIEKRLHNESGIPPPEKLENQLREYHLITGRVITDETNLNNPAVPGNHAGQGKNGQRMVGMVPFQTIVNQLRRKAGLAEKTM